MKSALPRIAGLTILVGALLTLTTAAASAQVVTDPVTGHSFGIVPSAGANRSLSNSTAPLRAASRRLPFTATCNADGHDCTPLAYNGGPVQHQQQLYLFFWDPSSQLPAPYKAGLGQWLNDLAAANTSTTPISVTQQYYDDTGSGGTEINPFAVARETGAEVAGVLCRHSPRLASFRPYGIDRAVTMFVAIEHHGRTVR